MVLHKQEQLLAYASAKRFLSELKIVCIVKFIFSKRFIVRKLRNIYMSCFLHAKFFNSCL